LKYRHCTQNARNRDSECNGLVTTVDTPGNRIAVQFVVRLVTF
jgi:hypothetical protein